MAPRSGGLARERVWWYVLGGVLLASAGVALSYGTLTPRDFGADEPAHTAYADLVADGELPDVDTIKPERREAVAAPGEATASDRVYVANHPPLFAAAQGGLARLLAAVGLDVSTLAVGRALNALCTLGAVAVTAALARAATGSLRTGVLAAAFVAAIPGLWSVATYGYSDGLGVLATASVAWAAVHVIRAGSTRSLVVLAAAVALAASARATALLAAVAMGVAVCVVLAGRARDPRPGGGSTSLAHRAGAFVTSAVLVFGPAAVVAGWWYVRNWARFGDPAASEVLNERLGRTPHDGGTLGALFEGSMWRSMLRDLFGSAYTATWTVPQVRLPAWALLLLVALAVAAVVGIALVVGRDRRGFVGWSVVLAGVAAVLFGIAAHVGEGGTAHPRYLIPVLPLLAVPAVVGLDELHPAAPVVGWSVVAAASTGILVMARTWIHDIEASEGLTSMGPDGLGRAGLVVAAAALVGTGALVVGRARRSAR